MNTRTVTSAPWANKVVGTDGVSKTEEPARNARGPGARSRFRATFSSIAQTSVSASFGGQTQAAPFSKSVESRYCPGARRVDPANRTILVGSAARPTLWITIFPLVAIAVPVEDSCDQVELANLILETPLESASHQPPT